MDTSTTITTIKIIIVTINNETLESNKVNSNGNKISKFVKRRLAHGIIMTKDNNELR